MITYAVCQIGKESVWVWCRLCVHRWVGYRVGCRRWLCSCLYPRLYPCLLLPLDLLVSLFILLTSRLIMKNLNE